jgi:hypothetical protein
VETGQRGIRCKELRELLTEYGVSDGQQKILTTLANPRGALGRQLEYADAFPGAWQDYLILEAAAMRISAYEPQRIPALLRTPAYARELAEAAPGLEDGDARDRAVAAVLARQKAILGERKPDIHVIIGEAALRQEVGGPEVMEGQLGLLAGISGGSGAVTVQILPFSSGAHAAAGIGSLAMLGFDEVPGLGIVHLGGASGESAWKARRISPFMPGCSGSCGRSRSAPRSPRSCSAASQTPETAHGLRHRANRGGGTGSRSAGCACRGLRPGDGIPWCPMKRCGDRFIYRGLPPS